MTETWKRDIVTKYISRYLQIVGTIITAPFLFFVIFLPESPRWLFANDKEEQGIKVTNKLARINKVTISDETWDEARKAGEEKVNSALSSTRSAIVLLFISASFTGSEAAYFFSFSAITELSEKDSMYSTEVFFPFSTVSSILFLKCFKLFNVQTIQISK